MASITSATATYLISIPLLFPVPQQLQGFTADSIFDTTSIKSAETLMGVDGRLSGGFVFVPIEQNIDLQADSESNAFFDLWWQTQQLVKDVYIANAVVMLKSINSKWVLTKGFLTGFHPIPDAKKTLMPRKYQITWESVSMAAA